MAKSLPDRPSLESLRKQAKALLRSWRAEDAEARQRVRQHHPKPETFSSLRDAQLVLAREYGQVEDVVRAVEQAACWGRIEQLAGLLAAEPLLSKGIVLVSGATVASTMASGATPMSDRATFAALSCQASRRRAA